MDKNVIALRKALKKNVMVADGTVVRWRSNSMTMGRSFSYVAIFIYAVNKWYISGTGRFYGGNEFTSAEFTRDVLGRSEVSDVEVATSFEAV